jgi:hypothetical protein
MKKPSAPVENVPVLSRRSLLGATAAASALAALEVRAQAPAAPTAQAPAPAQLPGRFELEELSVAALQARMQAGQERARSLTETYLAR